MNRIASTLILFFWALIISAQNISVLDFRLDEMDLTANLQGTSVIDQNGEKCGLIKIKTTQMGFSFDVGSLGVKKTEQKTAEIWVYVPHGVRKLNISHQKFGQLNYQLPVTIQKAKTYILDLKAETPLPVDHQRLKITCKPKTAVVMIDGKMADVQNGECEITLKLGSHKYVAMANGYYEMEGAVELVADGPGRLPIDLEPKEGTLPETPSTQTTTPTANDKLANAPDVMSVTVQGVTFEMVKVTGGTFTMGATPEQIDEAEKKNSLYIRLR